MTSPNEDRFDWDAAEADVVDLDAVRAARIADDADDGPVLVDSPEAQKSPRITVAGLRAGQRRPILPAWLCSRDELRDAVRWTVGHATHSTGYHLLRVPKYAGKLAVRSPRGAYRVTRATVRWLFDLEGEQVRQATVRREDAEEYLKLSRQRDRRVRWRGIVATFGIAVMLAGGISLVFAPSWARWGILAMAVTLFGMIGQPADKPLLDGMKERGLAPRDSRRDARGAHVSRRRRPHHGGRVRRPADCG
ncbi:hypothetical protein ABGB07_45995, partial [Micromonosporaceae bacterium B7E4]